MIFHVGTESAAAVIRSNPVLSDCVFSTGTIRPKVVLLGTHCSAGEELRKDLYNQNESVRIACRGDLADFKKLFRPVRCWRDKGRKTYSSIADAAPPVRKPLVEEMEGKVHLGWMRVRVTDYIGANRCYRCQNYGHIAKFCPASSEKCGHCAGEGHSLKGCPNLDKPPSSGACKNRRKTSIHSNRSKTCPSYLQAARQNILRTDFGDKKAELTITHTQTGITKEGLQQFQRLLDCDSPSVPHEIDEILNNYDPHKV